MLHGGIAHHKAEGGGQQHDDHQAGKHHAQRGGHSAKGAAHAIAHKGGGVYGDHARRTLADGKHIQQLILIDPVLAFHTFALEHGQHGIAAAKGERADAGKCGKQLGALRRFAFWLFHNLTPL